MEARRTGYPAAPVLDTTISNRRTSHTGVRTFPPSFTSPMERTVDPAFTSLRSPIEGRKPSFGAGMERVMEKEDSLTLSKTRSNNHRRTSSKGYVTLSGGDGDDAASTVHNGSAGHGHGVHARDWAAPEAEVRFLGSGSASGHGSGFGNGSGNGNGTYDGTKGGRRRSSAIAIMGSIKEGLKDYIRPTAPEGRFD